MGTAIKMNEGKMTLQEEQFALTLVGNGGRRKEAFVEVYGDIPNPSQAAAKLAKKPHVAERIADLMTNELEIAQTNAKRVIVETSRIAFANVLDIFDPDIYREEKRLVLLNLEDIPRHLSAAIKKIKSHAKGIEVEFHDKTRVLQDMQKRFGLLGERKDAEAQQVHIHLDMRGDGPVDLKAPAIDVTPKVEVDGA